MSDDLKELLMKRRIQEREVSIDGVGTVRVRGLTRQEVLGAQEITEVGRFEAEMISLGLVDPAMTVEEVQAWQAAAPAGELEPVAEAIKDLSALTPVAEKEAMARFRGEPGS